MAPIQRRRFVDTSDSPVSSDEELQGTLPLEENAQTGTTENAQEGAEGQSHEKIVVRPRIKRRVPRTEGRRTASVVKST